MVSKLRLWWQKTSKTLDAVIIISLVIVLVLLVLIILGYRFNWPWTGLHGKTLYDWLQLLIIPAVLAVGGYLFNYTISRNEQKTTQLRDQTERDVSLDNQREAALQAYIDSMSELLLEKDLRKSGKDDEVRKIARVRTLTVLPRLDGWRKRSVLLFLQESGLIDKDRKIIHLDGADLIEADLTFADLRNADLSSAILRESSLYLANLRNAELRETGLLKANLSGADMTEANLSVAFLHKAVMTEANLTEANLTEAILLEADLRDANLTGANLNKTLQSHLFGGSLPDGPLRGRFAQVSRAKARGIGVWQPSAPEHPWSDASCCLERIRIGDHGCGDRPSSRIGPCCGRCLNAPGVPESGKSRVSPAS